VLSERVVLNRAFEVHESHVPFILQAMMDLNVAGMALLSLPPERVVFRGELPTQPLLHQRVEPRSGVDAHGEPTFGFAAAEVAPPPEIGSGASVQTAGLLVRPYLRCPHAHIWRA
jgi:DNA polymerase zeta